MSQRSTAEECAPRPGFWNQRARSTEQFAERGVVLVEEPAVEAGEERQAFLEINDELADVEEDDAVALDGDPADRPVLRDRSVYEVDGLAGVDGPGDRLSGLRVVERVGSGDMLDDPRR